MAITLQPSPRQPAPTNTQQLTATDIATFLTTNTPTWYILPPATLRDLMGDTPATPQSVALAITAGCLTRKGHKAFCANSDNGPWEVSYQ